jgi:hypothetical protein
MGLHHLPAGMLFMTLSYRKDSSVGQLLSSEMNMPLLAVRLGQARGADRAKNYSIDVFHLFLEM